MGGSSSGGNPSMISDFDGNKFTSNPRDSFSDTLDKVYMNRVLNSDEPGNPMHFIMDNFRASSAFNRVAQQDRDNKK